MYENQNQTSGQTSGIHNGESANESAAQIKERLRAKATAAGETVRAKADQARGWAQRQLDGLQSNVEAQPYRATAWALGIGFVAGILLTGMVVRGNRP